MNPYEPPQEDSPRQLPVAVLAKPKSRPWHEDPDFVERNILLITLNCLIPWLIAISELLFAKLKTGFLEFNFLSGHVWFLLNLIWWGCFLGLSWTDGRQFRKGLYWLFIVCLNFVLALLLRHLPEIWTSPVMEKKLTIGLFWSVMFLGCVVGLVVSISSGLMLLLRFRSRLTDSRQALRESSAPANPRWSLWSMFYLTFLIAAAAAGLIADQKWGNMDFLIYLYPLYILLLWHEVLRSSLHFRAILAVISFGIGLQILHFKTDPPNPGDLRETLEIWISFNTLTITMGIAARWVGWRIVRRPPLKMQINKFVNRHVILMPEIEH